MVAWPPPQTESTSPLRRAPALSPPAGSGQAAQGKELQPIANVARIAFDIVAQANRQRDPVRRAAVAQYQDDRRTDIRGW